MPAVKVSSLTASDLRGFQGLLTLTASSGQPVYMAIATCEVLLSLQHVAMYGIPNPRINAVC